MTAPENKNSSSSEEGSVDVDKGVYEPKILHFKVYYGMGDFPGKEGKVERKPDPNKVLFYQGPNGKAFDVIRQEWVDSPEILNYLPSRPVLFDEKGQDILRAIVNGIIEDEDYEALDKLGLINDTCKKVYSLYKKALDLTSQIDALEKSEKSSDELTEAERNSGDEEDEDGGDSGDDDGSVFAVDGGDKEEEGDDDDDEEEEEDDYYEVPIDLTGQNDDFVLPAIDASVTKQGVDVLSNFLEVTGVGVLGQVRERFGEEGENLVIQIVRSALAGVDAKTKEIVEQEVSKQMKPISEAMETIMKRLGITFSNNNEDNQ